MAEKNNAQIRTFAAIEFPSRTKAIVQATTQQFKGIKGRISWVKPQGVHLTLKFLGKISPQQLGRVKAALEVSVDNITPFNLRLTELGIFPDKNHPRVIWWGVNADTHQLLKLRRNIENQLVNCGFPREQHPFIPHLTLGRVREIAQPQQLVKLISKAKLPATDSIAVNQLKLYKSTLTGTGAIYSYLASFPFGKNEFN